MSVKYKIERIKNTDVAEYKIRIFAFFLKIMLTWKIVVLAEASVLYIYID